LSFVLVVERVILRVGRWINMMVLGGFGVATCQRFLVHGHGWKAIAGEMLNVDEDSGAGAGYFMRA